MNRTVVATATLGLLGCVAAQAAGDAARGKEVAAVCAPCHGLDGVSPSPAFPILAGQHEIYLANSIRAYQAGQRPDAVLGGSVRTLTEKQIEDVAAYYACTERPCCGARGAQGTEYSGAGRCGFGWCGSDGAHGGRCQRRRRAGAGHWHSRLSGGRSRNSSRRSELLSPGGTGYAGGQ